MQTGLVIAGVLGLGLSACAEGIEPPVSTPMVEIRTGLEFSFGPEGFCLGSNDVTCSSNEKLPILIPKVAVKLAPFAIDIDEVTNFQYEYCVANAKFDAQGGLIAGCTDPQFGNAPEPTQFLYYREENGRFRDFPVVNVTWKQADEYCRFVGKRLPTEVEWERVAKGAGAPRQFPLSAELADPNACEGLLNSVGCGGDQKMERTGASSNDFVLENNAKIFHLAANAAEWTDTWYKLDVTCKGEAPCTRKDLCENDSNCITEAGICLDCASEPAENGECFFMCKDRATQASVICNRFTETDVDPAVFLPPTGADKVIRGGSVSTTRFQRCLLHSWNREQRNSVTFLANSLGFRCAKTL